MGLFRKKNKKEESKKVELKQVETENQDNSAEEWTSDYEGQLAIDVFQTPDTIVIKSAIAGVSPEDIDVTIDNDMVTIKGERKDESKIKKDDYYYQECYWGSFSRSVILPVDVETDKVEADIKNGILTVTLPKAGKSKTTQVTVKAS